MSVSQVEILSKSGRVSGKILKKLKSDIQQPITAILTLNTIAHTMGAAIAGAAAAAAAAGHLPAAADRDLAAPVQGAGGTEPQVHHPPRRVLRRPQGHPAHRRHASIEELS